MPTLPQGRLLVLSFSLVLSCVVIGVSFSLLYAPKPGNIPESDEYNVLAMKWRRFDYLLARDPDPFFDYDGDGFRTVPILGMVTSALNIFLGVIL
ncbi:hypothetical protein B0F90DRAFT_256055 [Multifurca ochricompacta]|uniref:Uncharacterized protein n=1 Tax=Multifurca ochricompacta TaxID=376703 RepID=A0AAD4QP55_9AGAM|nr:hypothetical protein B0F90DRAFT_256055 [Multifurca ochricompacta]